MNDDEFMLQLKTFGLKPEDVSENFSRSGGPGGQNVNKVNSAVELSVESLGIRIRCQESRSQKQNREIVRSRLISKLHAQSLREESAKRWLREKLKRQNNPRPESIKRKFKQLKRHRAKIQRERKRTSDDD